MEKHLSHSTFHRNAKGNLSLYHKDVYFPDGLKKACKTFMKNIKGSSLSFSNHISSILNYNVDGESREFDKEDILEAVRLASRRAESDKLDIFEAGTFEKKDGTSVKNIVEKVGFRLLLEEGLDICIFLSRHEGKYKIITAYINNSSDSHSEGFNSSRYVQAPIKKEEPKKEEPKKKVKIVIKRKKENNLKLNIFNRIYENLN